MAGVEQLSNVIGKIYDASLDATLWSAALEEACGFVQGCTANLFYQDNLDHGVALFASWGDDPDYTRRYGEAYAEMNPLFPASSFLEVGTVHSLEDMMSIEEFRTTRLYREWARPQGVLDALYTKLERTATGSAALAIRRRECDGLFGPDGKSRFALIAPHVRRAVAVGNVIQFQKAKAAALSRTFDGLGAAVLLVASDGRPVYVNEYASTMLTSGDILRVSRGRLAAPDPRVHRQLQDAIAAAVRGDMHLGAKGIAIRLVNGESPSHIVHVLSLTSGERKDMINGEASAALFVRETKLATPGPLESVAKLHCLTAGEVRVLAAFAEGGGVAAIATALGISQATVKTHLHRLFAKTGTRRQADLIKLLAAHASPLRH